MLQFSIIIPTCNRNELLAKCLERLAPAQQTFTRNYEVIVTDDGKNDEAKELIANKYPWAKWVAGPKAGPAANRNNGARHAAGEWLLFTDDDCLPNADWLAVYNDAILQYPGCMAFEGAIIPDDWNLLKKDLAECPVNTTGGCFWSANIMIQRLFFQSITGFDEQYKMAAQEDQDLQIRILQQTNIQFIKQAIVVHPVRMISLYKAIKKTGDKNHNYLYYANKNSKWLGFKNEREIIWKGGLKVHAITFFKHVRKRRWSNSILSAFNFMSWLSIYLFKQKKPG